LNDASAASSSPDAIEDYAAGHPATQG